MNSLQKIAHAPNCTGLLHRLRSFIKLTQISTGAEAALQLAVKDERMRIALQIIQSGSELLQFR